MKISTRRNRPDETLDTLVKALNNRLSIQENLQAKVLGVADTGTADTEFSVSHGLGQIPTVYIYNIDRSGIVYDSARATWTENVMKLKCSVANAVLILVVFY